MQLQEVILASSSSTAASTGPGSITLHDIQTGSSLASFKQTNTGSHCTGVVESGHGQGGFVLACQHEKSILNVYNFQKDQLALKIVLPEKLSCLAVDPRGEFCAGGNPHGRIYLWEVASGILFNAWDAHYRRVTVLKFTHDSAALLSGSEDSGVSVWSVSRLVHQDQQNELPMPACALSDHTLPVTDIICGVGSYSTCRVLTSSLDHSVKLWDIASKSLLTTFQFPQPISCLAWDPTERMFFAGSEEGSIFQMNLFRQADGKTPSEAIGGAGVAGIIRVEDEAPIERRKRLISVNQPVSCLAISMTSSLLLAGTSTGIIHIYDISSHQLLRTLNNHAGFSITHIATMLKPLDLIGHVSLNLSGNSNDIRDVIPVKPVAPFQRTRDAKARDAHEVAMLLPDIDSASISDALDYTQEEFLRDHASFVGTSATSPQSAASPGDAATLQSKVADLETEVRHLKEQLGKAKHVNDSMWEGVVQRVINAQIPHSGQDKESTPSLEAMDVDLRQPKRRRG